MGYRVAKKAWQYVQPFWYNTSVWRTDRRMDGQTDVKPIAITCFSIADARKNSRSNRNSLPWYGWWVTSATVHLMVVVTAPHRKTSLTQPHNTIQQIWLTSVYNLYDRKINLSQARSRSLMPMYKTFNVSLLILRIGRCYVNKYSLSTSLQEQESCKQTFLVVELNFQCQNNTIQWKDYHDGVCVALALMLLNFCCISRVNG